MITTVKKQHYIWEYYLKAWAIDNKIWCKRNNSIFNTSTENVGQERYFYETKILNDDEIKLIQLLINKIDSSSNILKSNFQMYLGISKGDKQLSQNGIESYHSEIESKVVEIINQLRIGNIDILNDTQKKIDFSLFLGMQYTRTKKIKEKKLDVTIPIPSEFKSCDFNKIYDVMKFLIAFKIGSWIYTSSKISLLSNPTKIDFITGDQPIYNLLAKDDDSQTDFELFYPISPKYALFISKEDLNLAITDENIMIYNEYIKKISYESIFANKKELLI